MYAKAVDLSPMKNFKYVSQHNFLSVAEANTAYHNRHYGQKSRNGVGLSHEEDVEMTSGERNDYCSISWRGRGEGGGFIMNQFQKRDIQTEDIGGKKRT